MKKVFLIWLSVFCISAMFVGCNKEDVTADNEVESQVIKFEVENVDVSKLNKDAVAYFGNIKTAIFATGSNLPETKSDSEENPLIEKLESIKIEKEETSDDVSFFEMTEVEQELFLSDWAILQAEQLSQKLVENPELAAYIQSENEVVEEVMNEEIIEVKGKSVVKDNKVFFAKIQERLAAKVKTNEETTPETKIGVSGGIAVNPANLRSALASASRRGDVLIALPQHGNTYVYLDFGNNQFAVGHAAIINTQVTNTTSLSNPITVAAQSDDGVTKETINYWSYQCYIVGLRQVKWVWKWRGFKSGFYQQITYLNPAPLATWAESYIGRKYVYWYEFLTAKWAAPSRFTCTTLVWWCAKKAYDINVSEWWKTMVTPSGLLTDESVYIRRVVNY